MTRTFLFTAAIAFALPLAAGAQTMSTAGTKCGPVSWSTDKMAYSSAPCTAESIGTGGPTANQAASAGSQSQSSSVTKAEQKAMPAPTTYSYAPAPVQQAQAVPMAPSATMSNSASMGSSMSASMDDQCGPSSAAAMKDEFGRSYNCRGDRVR